MLLLFTNLYLAMFTGSWTNYTWADLVEFRGLRTNLNLIGEFITSIFGDNQMTNLGDLLNLNLNMSYITLVSLILATITSIGIVVVATKGIKKLFTVFFYGVR